MEFHPEVELSGPAAEAIARGLYAVARVDGLHEREAALITSFWIDSGGGTGGLADLIRRAEIGPAELALALRTPEERGLFVKTAILLTHADGKVTDAERKKVSEFAAALAIDPAQLQKLEAEVKEFLLGHLIHLKNPQAATAVAQKLKI